ncbi:hypothetical protein Chor_015177 [Crotalus horridus]
MIFLLAFFASIFQTAFTGVNERTFLAIKPDGVQRHLVGEIIQRFEKKGFKLVAMKLMQASEELLKEHYISLRGRPFFSRLVKFMSSGPIVAMHSSCTLGFIFINKPYVISCLNTPTIITRQSLHKFIKNVVHGSDSVESAQREIALWFHSEELVCWKDSREHWIYE